MKPTAIELHLNAAPLTRAESKAIKAASGAFSVCRGYASTRYVTLSLDHEPLIDRLIAAHGSSIKRAAVFRAPGCDPRPSWVVVHYFTSATTLADLWQSYERASAEWESRKAS